MILGGRDHADDYYGGETFAVEMDLATALRDHLRLQGLDITVIYSPHPANQPLEKLFFPDGEEIVLFRHTQLSYFFANVGLSIYSSSMFEAAFFGARCFTPVTRDLGLFLDEFMSLLFTPDINSRHDMDMALKKLVQALPRNVSSHEDRILRRVERFFGQSG